MKKIISLLIVVSVLCAALVACGGNTDGQKINAPDEFIPADAEHASSLDAASGSVPKDVNTKEYAAGFAKAYNAMTEFLPYGADMNANGSFILVITEGEATSLFLVTRVADGMFNVSVNGAAADGGNYKFRIKNDELEKYIADELMTVKTVDVSCTVKFVLGAGTPDEDGNAREADETLFETEVKVGAPENEMPKVLSAIIAALSQSGAPEHRMNERSGFPSEIAGYGETVKAGEGAAERYFWKYYLGDGALEAGGAATKTYADGDVITLIYTASAIGGNS